MHEFDGTQGWRVCFGSWDNINCIFEARKTEEMAELQFTLLETEDIEKVWRPIHYLGSKLRLLSPIRTALSDLDPNNGPVCDLFAGSGTVSMMLASERTVIAADIQEYSRVLCSAVLHPADIEVSIVHDFHKKTEQRVKELHNFVEPILEIERHAINNAGNNPSLLCDIIERGCLLFASEGRDALSTAIQEVNSNSISRLNSLMVTRYFGGIYFSYQQALYIDAALSIIDELQPAYRDTCMAAILSTASALVNSIGKQFAQPMRPRRSDGTIKFHLISQICRDRKQDASQIFASWLNKYRQLPKTGAHQVLRGDYRDVLSTIKGISVIYADPPYTRDHYSRFYHVLETICLQDFPNISSKLRTEETASRGLYRKNRHQSPFCIKSQASEAFEELFSGSRRLNAPLLLSYSPFLEKGHPRMMTIDSIFEIASKYYKQIDVIPCGQFSHSKLSKTTNHLRANDFAEVLIKCQI